MLEASEQRTWQVQLENALALKFGLSITRCGRRVNLLFWTILQCKRHHRRAHSIGATTIPAGFGFEFLIQTLFSANAFSSCKAFGRTVCKPATERRLLDGQLICSTNWQPQIVVANLSELRELIPNNVVGCIVAYIVADLRLTRKQNAARCRIIIRLSSNLKGIQFIAKKGPLWIQSKRALCKLVVDSETAMKFGSSIVWRSVVWSA